MLTEQEVNRLINEFLDSEAMGKQIQQRSYNARKLLESVYSPASKGRKKNGLSDAVVRDFIRKAEQRMMRPPKTA